MNAARRAARKPQAIRADASPEARLIAATRKGDISGVRRFLAETRTVPLDDLLSLAVQSHGPRKQSKLLEVCDFLLASGADPNACSRYGPLLCLATTSGVRDYVDLLQRHGAKTDICSAAALGDVEGVRTRLRLSPPLARKVDRVARTPLHYCAGSRLWLNHEPIRGNLTKIGELLLDTGADIDAEFPFPLHSTPFSVAATVGGNVDLVKFLLERGADSGDLRLMFDVLRSMKRQDDEFSRIGELLIDNGLNINGDYVPTLSLLHGQARHEDVQATAWLLLHGADVNDRADDGRTPLHVAADRNRGTKVVELLLRHGAGINTRDDQGCTPLFYARQSQKHRIASFLEERGGRI